MSENPSARNAASLAEEILRIAQQASCHREEMKRTLLKLFAERRVYHINKGMGTDVINAYDYVVQAVINAATKCAAAVCIQLEAKDGSDARKQVLPHIERVVAMFTEDGFKVSLKTPEDDRLTIKIKDKGFDDIGIKRNKAYLIYVDISWVPAEPIQVISTK